MRTAWLVTAITILASVSTPAEAQLHVTPLAGGYLPASDLDDLRDQAEGARLRREGTLGLGLNLDTGWLRGSIAYASGARITAQGVENGDRVGDGTVLAAAVDLVIRPLPRMGVQPYVLGGVGLKRQDYSFEDDGLGSNPLSRESTDLAIHAGVGLDLMLGSFGLVAEVTDFITREPGDGAWGQHDAWIVVGLRFRI